MDLSLPFRGSEATATGSLTRGALRGPRFRRLLPDVYVPADLSVDLALRARAAAVWAGEGAVVAGWAAAELLGASCGPRDAPVDLIVRAGTTRPPAGVLLRRTGLWSDETTHRAGVVVTTPARTAFDVARWAPDLVERVAGVDAVAHVWRLEVDRIRSLWRRHLGAHGNADLAEVLRLVDPRAESPMESRIRVALHLAGLPRPRVQHRVGPHRLDLAYPEALLGVEHDGPHHREAEHARRDLEREAFLARAGWRVVRFASWTVLHEPDRIAREVGALLAAS
ncbi:endonuclease domain-containing protein [Pseudonocardia halophobica]|uniref:endonuclease domain-containing protein n=1 Tax=Pseudonocardia halophobica TaxID=29401 RepID=UPI003D8F4989